MVEEEIQPREATDEHADEDVLNMKQDAGGRALPKQSRIDVQGGTQILNRPAVRSAASKVVVDGRCKDKEKSKTKPSKAKNIGNALWKRVERFDLLKSIAQSPVGLNIGQLMRGDTEGFRSDVRKILFRQD